MVKAIINNIDVEVPEGTSILGAAGGAMEAAIRSAYFFLTSRKLENLDVKPVRGLQGIKEGEVDIKSTKINVAVAHSGSQARACSRKSGGQWLPRASANTSL